MNTPTYYEMTSAQLINGSGPGSTPHIDPKIVHLTDVNRTYIEDQGAFEDGVTADNFLLVKDATGRRWSRLSPSPIHKISLFDDFLGDALDARWALASGSDAQAVDPTIVAAVGGTARLVSGDVGGGDDAVDSSVLTSGLHWKAANGGLVAQFKVKLVGTVANTAIFLGLTDVSGTAEMPIHSAGSADTVTDNATDAVGIMYDTAMTTDEWGIIGTKNGTQTTYESIGNAPTADTFETFRIEVSSAGAVTVYRNGVEISTVANAVTASVALTPVVAVMSRTTTSVTADVDYILVEGNR